MSQLNEQNIAIVNFYCFIKIANIAELKAKILLFCRKKYLKGTIFVAEEGFNGSLAGLLIDNEKIEDKNTNFKDIFDKLLDLIAITGGYDKSKLNIISKITYCQKQPFDKLTVKIKQQTVMFGNIKLDIEQRGEYINAQKWDEFIKSDDVLVIDTRNDYEVTLGSFKNAVNPMITSFRDLADWIELNKQQLHNKKIAMYCTGGIRCEKSTAYLKAQGFTEVYHLKGGILEYLAETKNANNIWQGQCFVFDDRIAVNQFLKPIYEIS